MGLPAGVPRVDGLPPREFWLVDPRRRGFEPIPTSLDDRGLVDVPSLISDVKATISPEFEWEGGPDVHHFYWPANEYKHRSGLAIDNPSFFRNIPIHKGLLPRVFHNWLHEVTLPAPQPEPEVMAYRIEAWRVAHSLFKNARQAIHWQKMAKRRELYVAQNPEVIAALNGEDIIGEEVMQETLERHFNGLERHMERLRIIPPEFRLIEPIDDKKDTPRLAQMLGRIMAGKNLRLVPAVVKDMPVAA